MRKPDVTALAASKASLVTGHGDEAPVKLVCLALVLALVVLAGRIVTVW
jgi:hypothetical protein